MPPLSTRCVRVERDRSFLLFDASASLPLNSESVPLLRRRGYSPLQIEVKNIKTGVKEIRSEGPYRTSSEIIHLIGGTLNRRCSVFSHQERRDKNDPRCAGKGRREPRRSRGPGDAAVSRAPRGRGRPGQNGRDRPRLRAGVEVDSWICSSWVNRRLSRGGLWG